LERIGTIQLLHLSTETKYRNEFLSEYFPQLADTKKLKMLAEMVKACGGEIDYQLGAFIYTIKFE
jgi:hypothetical protein